MPTAYELLREIMAIEAMIETPAAKGQRTTLRAYHRKLCTAYRRALANGQ